MARCDQVYHKAFWDLLVLITRILSPHNTQKMIVKEYNYIKFCTYIDRECRKVHVLLSLKYKMH